MKYGVPNNHLESHNLYLSGTTISLNTFTPHYCEINNQSFTTFTFYGDATESFPQPKSIKSNKFCLK
jgi:hypothetical protein